MTRDFIDLDVLAAQWLDKLAGERSLAGGPDMNVYGGRFFLGFGSGVVGRKLTDGHGLGMYIFTTIRKCGSGG
jgi:hypothetical protein